ncbi:MAG TPA: hypothetical protein VMH05_15385 [Bryobacteraceae bacterium]|nr:hypothetical protein [Bryobacteraceae bacterium]
MDATLNRTESDGGILALAHNLETIHALPLLAPVTEQSIQNVENGRDSYISATATLIEENPIQPGPEFPSRFVLEDRAAPAEQALLVLAEETLAIPVKQTVDSLVRPLVESVDAADDTQLSPKAEAGLVAETQSPDVPSDVSVVEPETSSEPAAAPELEAAVDPAEDQTPEPETSIAPLAQVPPALEAPSITGSTSEAAAVPEPRASEPEQAPEPEVLPVMAAAELNASPEVQAVASPEQVDILQLALNLEPPPLDPPAQGADAVECEVASEPSGQPAALTLGTSEPEPAQDQQDARDLEASEALLGALELHAEALVGAIHSELEAERAAIAQLAVSFQQCCSTALLAAPAEIVTAPAPPVFEWIRTPRPILQPMPPPAGNLVGQNAQPSAPTLAGPCLSPELRNLTELENPKRLRKSRPFPGWMASLLGATLLVLLAVTSLQYFGSQNDAKASTDPGSQNAATANGAGEALNKTVEISGLRLATTWTGKQQVRFLIVNHSDRDLSGVTVQVAVRSSDLASGAAPILLIHAPLRSLGPYQSKEIRTDLDSGLPASALSDWQSLRTEVQVTRGE